MNYQLWNRNEKTICAISTPHGHGAIGIIRVTGPSTLAHCQKLIPKLKTLKVISHKAYLAHLYDLDNNKIDEVLFTYFAKGHSYTGEETIEISCHGSTYITNKILDTLVKSGCTLAEKGEFTFRAFMNNKIDLIQAESVLSLIESQNELSAKMALRQLEGALSKVFLKIESDLTWCLAHIEASIDFSTENIEIIETSVLINKLESINKDLAGIINSYSLGKNIKDGVKVVLVGKPNVGKSTLLNCLVQEEKAIVTSIAGTTRDIIESTTLFSGLKFTISDTAGLRNTDDFVEKIGVNKSIEEASKADILCCVISIDNLDSWKESIDFLFTQKSTHKVIIVNKSDLIDQKDFQNYIDLITAYQPQITTDIILFSAVNSIDQRNVLLHFFKKQITHFDFLSESIISSTRQLESSKYCLEMLSQSIDELNSNMGAEFVAMYLKQGLMAIQKTLGHVYDDQILDRVFKEFCLGK